MRDALVSVLWCANVAGVAVTRPPAKGLEVVDHPPASVLFRDDP